MKLLIDAGNSRVKWGVHDGEQWCAQGAVVHDDMGQLSSAWAPWPIQQAFATLVAGKEVRSALETACGVPIHWVEAGTEWHGVRNHYLDPLQMGADRWLAVVATHQQYRKDVIVVCAGTAMTVESLIQEGDYLGGLIVPGYNMMLRSLAHNTARLNQPAGCRVDFPLCTEDALASGAIEALVGVIERARARLALKTGRPLPMVMITGGDAPLIAPWLASTVRIVDNLVLMGLLEVANEL